MENQDDKLHEIRVNGILQAFAAQRDAALAREATLLGEKAVYEARIQTLMMHLSNSQAELQAVRSMSDRLAEENSAMKSDMSLMSLEKREMQCMLETMTTPSEPTEEQDVE